MSDRVTTYLRKKSLNNGEVAYGNGTPTALRKQAFTSSNLVLPTRIYFS